VRATCAPTADHLPRSRRIAAARAWA